MALKKNSQPSHRGMNPIEEKRVLEKLKSLLNWLNQRNFEKIKNQIIQTIRESPSAFSLKDLVCCVFDMAMLDNAYVLFACLCVELFHQLPPFRSEESHGEITTFEKLFMCRCRMELENSSPKTDRPPLVYEVEANCWRFVKTVRFLAEVFKNSMVSETTRQSIIQVLMDPIFPPERNTDTMNLFLSSIGKLSEFRFCDESFKQLVQSSRAVEFESKYNEEVRLRKEAEAALARKTEQVEMRERLLVSYKEEQETLQLKAQALEQKHQEELRVRLETEYAIAIERKRVEKLKLQLQNLQKEHDDMRLKAEEFESKYKDEVILKKESDIALEKERSELEETRQMLETYKVEEENLISQVSSWQKKHEEELSLRKETEEALSREKEELEIVKGLLESYNQEADAMREERDNALKTVQELTRKQSEKRELPGSFFCPITQEVMKDPQVTADGFTYEGEAIRKWFSIGKETSPKTNLKLPNRTLVPNWALRSAIEESV